ncbi:acyltransferase family protein [Mucilaginibacter antarcticus]|uniref:Acyltransferase family protein n=1 Tax=Mucilaginibacter antarcticus TaxID=1855725 RepID=A0ABW5XSY9_9SPHI
MNKSFNAFIVKLFSKIDTVPQALNRNYYPSIDGLRALAVLQVIALHVLIFKNVNIPFDDTVGVHIFFIISGFLITTLLLKEKVKYGKISFKNFYIRRFLRILPVAYLYLLTLIILNLFFHFGLPFKSLLTSLFYLNNFPLPTTLQTHHFWTLATEEQFYLVAPFLLIANINRYIKLILFLTILVPFIDYVGFNNVGVFYSNYVLHKITYLLVYLLNYGTMYIFAGSLFSILVFKGVLVVEKFQKRYFLSTLLFVLAIVMHWIFNAHPILKYFGALCFSVLMGLVLVVNLYENNFLTKLLSTPILVKIGVLSYSLYIWQQIFVVQPPWLGLFKYSDNIYLNILLLFIVAFCSYHFYEIRFLRLKSKFKAK